MTSNCATHFSLKLEQVSSLNIKPLVSPEIAQFDARKELQKFHMRNPVKNLQVFNNCNVRIDQERVQKSENMPDFHDHGYGKA